MDLYQLIYVSTATTEHDRASLDRILETSVRRNTSEQVTGMLLYVGGSFMQALEGEKDAVLRIYERITQDPRHTDLYVIEEGPIGARNFGNWSMGFRRLGAADAKANPAYAPLLSHGFSPERLNARPGVTLDILKNFASTQR